MKYYSESLNKIFDNVDALKKAEAEAKAAEQKKKEKAKQQEARKAEAIAAYDNAVKLMSNYIKDYGKIDFIKYFDKEDTSYLSSILKMFL